MKKEIDNDNYFGENFRYYREKKHISQLEIAEELGVNQSSISNWESGKRTPRNKKLLKRIYEYLDIENDIFTEDLKNKIYINEKKDNHDKFREILIEKNIIDADNNISEEYAKKIISIALDMKKIVGFKEFLTLKGLIPENDDITEEEAEKIVLYGITNRNLLIKK